MAQIASPALCFVMVLGLAGCQGQNSGLGGTGTGTGVEIDTDTHSESNGSSVENCEEVSSKDNPGESTDSESNEEESNEDESKEDESKEEPKSEEESESETGIPANLNKSLVLLERDDWAVDVKQGLNDFLILHGEEGASRAQTAENSRGKEYVVFDFDNTCCIFDTQVEFFVYQTEHMAYALTPEEMKAALLDNLKKADQADAEGLTERDYIEDIIVAYQKLWDSYGPFTPAGLSDEKAKEMQQDPYYKEFFVKMKVLYSKVSSMEGSEISCFWLHSAFAGMTREEVYHLATECFTWDSQMESSYVTVASPDPALFPSKTGQRSTTVTRGIYVTENIRELMKALYSADMDIYICSASMDLTILAAVDYFGMRDYVTAVMGVCSETTERDGKTVLTSRPAPNGGYAWYSSDIPYYTTNHDQITSDQGNVFWRSGNQELRAIPQGPGKVTAIENAVMPGYGYGPAAGFMDSGGDFNFCTEFASLELVVCFNRGWRYVTDGGGLVGEVALLQASRGETLESAMAKGDTLYLLQGRDETGRGCLIADHGSVHLVPDQAPVYRLLENDSNEQMLSYMKEHALSVKEAFDRFAIRTEVGGDNPFAFRYGFLESYSGYHSRAFLRAGSGESVDMESLRE